MITRFQRHAQSGLSLVELMISLVLGLIVIAAVFNVYTGNNRSTQFTKGMQTMQENGRYGVSVIQRGLRLAGYSSEGAINAIDIAASGANKVTVRSQQNFDCNGSSTVPTQGIAVNTYRHDAEGDALTCQGNQLGSTPIRIVEGVEEFRLLYGLDLDRNTLTSEPQTYVPYNVNIKPKTVVALRFAMLVSSQEPVRRKKVEKTYVLMDLNTTIEDRMLREVYSGTVKLRNRE